MRFGKERFTLMTWPLRKPMSQALLQGQGDSNTSEFRIIRYSDGAVRHIEIAQTLLRGEDGLPSKLIGTNVDITERKLAEVVAEKKPFTIAVNNQPSPGTTGAI